MSDAGISALFFLWSLTTLVLEVPSGAVADAWSRPRMLALGTLLAGVAFTGWVVVPTTWSFAAGFVLWGAGSALTSGTLEALTYDALAVRGLQGSFGRLHGWARAGSLAAVVVAALAAAPLVTAGGYLLVGLVSGAGAVLTAALALTLPDDRPGPGPDPRSDGAPEGGGPVAAWWSTLGAGLVEVRRNALVRRAVVTAALVTGLVAVDEYLPLLAADGGAGPALVAVLIAGVSVGEIGGALAAARWARPGPRALGAMTAVAGAAVSVGVLLPLRGDPGALVAGFVLLGLGFGLLQLIMVALETRVQDAATGRARATVTSASGFGAEAVALGVLATVGLGTSALALPVVVAALMAPMVGAALLIAAGQGWRKRASTRPERP